MNFIFNLELLPCILVLGFLLNRPSLTPPSLLRLLCSTCTSNICFPYICICGIANCCLVLGLPYFFSWLNFGFACGANHETTTYGISLWNRTSSNIILNIMFHHINHLPFPSYLSNIILWLWDGDLETGVAEPDTNIALALFLLKKPVLIFLEISAFFSWVLCLFFCNHRNVPFLSADLMIIFWIIVGNNTRSILLRTCFIQTSVSTLFCIEQEDQTTWQCFGV